MLYQHNLLHMSTGTTFSDSGLPVIVTVISSYFTPTDGISLDLKINRHNTNDIQWLNHPKYINKLDFTQLSAKRLLISVARLIIKELNLASQPGVCGYSEENRINALDLNNDITIHADVRVLWKIPIGITLRVYELVPQDKLIREKYIITQR